jgi:hypothetical protein
MPQNRCIYIYIDSRKLIGPYQPEVTVATPNASPGVALITGVVLQTDGKVLVTWDANSNSAVARCLAQLVEPLIAAPKTVLARMAVVKSLTGAANGQIVVMAVLCFTVAHVRFAPLL